MFVSVGHLFQGFIGDRSCALDLRPTPHTRTPELFFFRKLHTRTNHFQRLSRDASKKRTYHKLSYSRTNVSPRQSWDASKKGKISQTFLSANESSPTLKFRCEQEETMLFQSLASAKSRTHVLHVGRESFSIPGTILQPRFWRQTTWN